MATKHSQHEILYYAPKRAWAQSDETIQQAGFASDNSLADKSSKDIEQTNRFLVWKVRSLEAQIEVLTESLERTRNENEKLISYYRELSDFFEQLCDGPEA